MDFATFEAAFISHTALLIYLTIAGAATLLVCGFYAARAIDKLHHVKPEDFFEPIGGPHPSKDGTLDKRIARQTTFKWHQIMITGGTVFRLFVAAIVVPTLLFALTVKKYDWMNPGDAPFTVGATAVRSLDTGETASFISSQFARSALLDTVEIFDLDLSHVSYRHGDIAMELLVFVYRSFTELFAAGFFLAAVRFLLLAIRKSPGLRQLEFQRSMAGKLTTPV